MSSINVYTLIIFKDMTHKLYKTKKGFLVNVNDEVDVVYNAINHNDAMLTLTSYISVKVVETKPTNQYEVCI